MNTNSSQVHNCYRAILAQINQLDSIYRSKNHLKDLYEELTELAFYIMEDDYERLDKGIGQLRDTVWELNSNPAENAREVAVVIHEIVTHLDFLRYESARCREA